MAFPCSLIFALLGKRRPGIGGDLLDVCLKQVFFLILLRCKLVISNCVAFLHPLTRIDLLRIPYQRLTSAKGVGCCACTQYTVPLPLPEFPAELLLQILPVVLKAAIALAHIPAIPYFS